MLKTILVPVDGSEVSFKALDYAINEAKVHGAKLIVSNVIIPYNLTILELQNKTVIANELDYSQLPQPEVDKKGKHPTTSAENFILKAAEKRAKKSGYEAIDYKEIIHVNPARAIVEQAEATKADLIVIGNRGMGEFAQFMLGSVSTKVASYAQIPVVIIK